MESSKSSAATSSASEHESFSDVEVLTTRQYNHAGHPQSQAKTTTRYIMADDRLQQKTIGRFQSVQKNFAITPSYSQFFIGSNNHINSGFPYYNERAAKHFMPIQSFQRYPQPYRQNVEFSAFQAQQQHLQNIQPEYYLPRYVPNPQRFAASSHVVENHMTKKAGQLAGYMPNSNRNRLFAVVDSYGSRYNINYPPGTGPKHFYANPAFDGSQSNVNNSDQMELSLTPVLDRKFGTLTNNSDTKSLSERSHVEEILGPTSTRWGVPGGLGNTFNSSKYYRDQDADEQPFYPPEFGVKDIGSPKQIGRCSKKCKIATLLTLLGIFVLFIVVGSVIAGVYHKGNFV